MNIQHLFHSVAAMLCVAHMLQPTTCVAQGTAFAYQGRLDSSGSPVNGIYDLRFTIYEFSGGAGIVAGPMTNSPVTISNGLFTMMLDFGARFLSRSRGEPDRARLSRLGGEFREVEEGSV